jgi:CRISPR/Cas system-associated endonuclease Cas1
VGFDPFIGFYRQPRFGRPALALDLMEGFRPLIVDSAVITAINTRMATHPLFGYRVNYRRVLEIQARLLARVVMGELPRYPGFETR